MSDGTTDFEKKIIIKKGLVFLSDYKDDKGKVSVTKLRKTFEEAKSLIDCQDERIQQLEQDKAEMLVMMKKLICTEWGGRRAVLGNARVLIARMEGK